MRGDYFKHLFKGAQNNLIASSAQPYLRFLLLANLPFQIPSGAVHLYYEEYSL